MPNAPTCSDTAAPQPQPGAPAIDSAELLQGRREVLIHHAGQTYRLRLTASNKLILVK